MGKSDEDKSFEFMMEEYKHITSSFLSNEELGEKRVTFFITLVSSLLGGGAALWTFLDIQINPVIISMLLVILFMLGILTLNRVIHRNLVTSEYLRKLSKIRTYFIQIDYDIQEYLPYKPDMHNPVRKKKGFGFGKGGWVETLAFINSILILTAFMLPVFIFLSNLNISAPLKFIILFLAFILSINVGLLTWYWQIRYIKYEYEKNEYDIITGRDNNYISPKKDQEMETKFIVISKDPQKIFDKVLNIKTIAFHPLIPKSEKKIKDVYYDTKNNDLGQREYALRVRTIKGDKKVTFKGPGLKIPSGGSIRNEKELELTPENLLEILKIIDSKLIITNGYSQNIKKIRDKKNIDLKKIGFKVIHKRTTHRTCIDVMDRYCEEKRAEISLDRVHYFKNGPIHYEIEVEMKQGNELLMKSINKELKETINRKCFDFLRFNLQKQSNICLNQNYIKKWNYSKTQIGIAVRELYENDPPSEFSWEIYQRIQKNMDENKNLIGKIVVKKNIKKK